MDARARVLGSDDIPAVVDVLCEAFFDYPVMRFVLGAPPDYPARLRELTTYFVMARVARREWLFGIQGSERLSAVAAVSRPSNESPPSLTELRERLWTSLGPEARARYECFGSVTARFEVSQPHIHLNQLGVRRTSRGQGLARILLEAVHNLSAEDPSSEGVTLTTEVEENVGLYTGFGYAIVGVAPVESSFTTWSFFRRDR